MAEDELLDVCDADGRWQGTATRRDVHRQGLWHRTLHLWLASAADGGSLLFQLRADTTANWPGLLDVSVAGHLLAGEDHHDALRESEEEIGLAVAAADVILLGTRREEHPDPSGGWNRELQGIHLMRSEDAWERFSAVDREAAGLIRVPNIGGRRLHRGEIESLTCDALTVGREGTRRERRQVTRQDFVPRAGYYTLMHDLSDRLLAGEPGPALAEAHERGR